MPKYRYDIHITGVVDAKDEDVARTIAELGFNLNGRLLKNKHRIMVKIEDVTGIFHRIKEGLTNG